MKHKNWIQMLLSLLPAGGLLVIDQLTKYWAYSDLRLNGSISIIENVFSFTYARNDGAAWGLFGGSEILNWLPILIALAILFIYQRVPMSKRMLPCNIGLIALFSGAVGNRIDRSVYGYVQDFIYFEPINFPIFNIADCYIVVSVIFLAILFIFYYKDENELEEIFSMKKKKEDESAEKTDEQ